MILSHVVSDEYINNVMSDWVYTYELVQWKMKKNYSSSRKTDW
jgi:hypothetical protein